MYGLLQRSDRKYDEAIKCYRNALKLDQVLFPCLVTMYSVLEGVRTLVGLTSDCVL